MLADPDPHGTMGGEGPLPGQTDIFDLLEQEGAQESAPHWRKPVG